MCIAATGRRRRKQARQDKRYKNRDPIARAARYAKMLRAEMERKQRKKK